MKGIIFCYSTTGNTELICRHIASQLKNVELCFHDIREELTVDLSLYDIVGFAAFTDWWDIPHAVERFIDDLPMQRDKYAFVLNTYAQISGKTLRTLGSIVEKKGFMLVAAHSFRMPGNYPPSIAKGRLFLDKPKDHELEELDRFITQLDKAAAVIREGKEISPIQIKIGVLNSILRSYPRTQSKDIMGELFVDETLCTRCGKCKNQCAYKAIEFDYFPVFNNERCYGCWACFNNCPKKAIYTSKIRGVGHYPFPSISFNKSK